MRQHFLYLCLVLYKHDKAKKKYKCADQAISVRGDIWDHKTSLMPHIMVLYWDSHKNVERFNGLLHSQTSPLDNWTPKYNNKN
jgi:hypothetical protein